MEVANQVPGELCPGRGRDEWRRQLTHARRQWWYLGGWAMWRQLEAEPLKRRYRIAVARQVVAMATYLADGSCSGRTLAAVGERIVLDCTGGGGGNGAAARSGSRSGRATYLELF